MKNLEVERINKEIKLLYGSNLSGNSHFRIVWSDDQLEYRKGVFNDFYGSIFIRTFEGVKQVPKYNYINSRWILEVFVPPILNTALPNQDGYEPLYVFESAKGEYLPPKLQVCKIIIDHVMNPQMNSLQRKELFETVDKKSFDKDVEYFKDEIEDGSSYMAGLLRAGEAIVVPENKKEEVKNN